MNSATRALHEFRNNHAPVPPKPAIQMAPVASAAPPPSGSTDSSPLLVGLTSLAEGWPEAVRQELVQLSLVDAKVALPAEVVERALKQGRVAFTWKTLRSWIKPTPLPAVSAHDSIVLELPLKVVAPPFLARQREAAKPQKKVSVDDGHPQSVLRLSPAGGEQPHGGLGGQHCRRQARGHEFLCLGRHHRPGPSSGR